MRLVVFAALVGIFSYVGWTVYSQYRASTLTGWHRWLAAAQGSATILWAKFCILVTAGTGLLSEAADYLGDPAIGAAIQAHLTPPIAAAFGIFVMVIVIWARKRTL